MTAPDRRRFRWSLRTMFVVVTVFAVWLGWHFSDIHQRQVMRNLIKANKGAVVVDPRDDGNPSPDIPKWRRLLGDEGAVDFIALPDTSSDEQVSQVRRLFPEAQVIRAKYRLNTYRRWKVRP
jgi:hypothetical protein